MITPQNRASMGNQSNASRRVVGDGITIMSQETLHGTVLSAIPQGEQPQAAATSGMTYEGLFAVTIENDSQVSIARGYVISGYNVTTKVPTTHTIGTTNGTYYLYAEIYVYGSWTIGYVSSTSYPTQAVKNISGTDYQCLRVLIATVTVADNIVSSVIQQQFGEIHNTRAV